MKKKILIWLGSIIGLVVLTIGVTLGLLHFATNSADKKVSKEKDMSEYKEAPKEEEEKESITAPIEGVFMNLPINESSSEEEVITAMHHMTHQKVIAEKKWGVIPMSRKNAERVRDILNVSNFEKKAELLAIAERWVDGNHSLVVSDHNYFWKLQGGSVGKATGVLDLASERKFVSNNFGEEISSQLVKQGDLK
ncbi:PRK06770 family protein [Bacillus cereus group sp. BfR-BA-01383]|uniref:PRK06770 family protein n=1 Tax=Bacillus cereus group sp. BfR-BA-01383 TaxID=2920327 RepID=UPI001F5A2159|nr:PRK06770 family protein [Bacillus cereus group sp. BfR-BA-01383]